MDKNVQPIKRTYAKRELKRSQLTPLEHKAYSIWGHQRDRCHNENNENAIYYGSKGIAIRYTRKELVDWLNKNYDGSIPIKDLVIGRIDHDKDYSFDNIRIESRSESTNEMLGRTRDQRVKKMARKVGLFSKKTHECIAIFNSITDCANYFNRNSSAIGKACVHPRPKGAMKNNWYFRFVKDEFGTII